MARAAAEAIRGLNHATRDHAGLDQPSAAYDVLGALSQAASGLPQLTAQITSYLDQALAAGKLRPDRGEDPALSVDGAVIFLRDARRSAAALARDLDAAWQQLAPSSTAAPPPSTRTSHDRQAPGPTTGSPACRSAVTSPPACCTATAAHNEAVARITWCITERAIGVITGEVSAGKTASVRTVLAGLDASPAHHHLPAQPHDRRPRPARDDRRHLRRPARPVQLPGSPPRPPPSWPPNPEPGRTPVLAIDEAHLLRYEQLETIRMPPTTTSPATPRRPPRRPAHPAPHHETRRPGRTRAARRPPLHHAPHDPAGDHQLHHPPPATSAGRADTLVSDNRAHPHPPPRGYPRAVNNLALQALVATYAAGKAIVDEAAARCRHRSHRDRLSIPATPRAPGPARLRRAGPSPVTRAHQR